MGGKDYFHSGVMLTTAPLDKNYRVVYYAYREADSGSGYKWYTTAVVYLYSSGLVRASRLEYWDYTERQRRRGRKRVCTWGKLHYDMYVLIRGNTCVVVTDDVAVDCDGPDAYLNFVVDTPNIGPEPVCKFRYSQDTRRRPEIKLSRHRLARGLRRAEKLVEERQLEICDDEYLELGPYIVAIVEPRYGKKVLTTWQYGFPWIWEDGPHQTCGVESG